MNFENNMAQSKQYVRRSDKPENTVQAPGNLLFGKRNYLFMVIGIVFILLGFALMAGGSMPSPDVWDESLIYSFRRITLAPIMILAGLGLQVYAIFVKKD